MKFDPLVSVCIPTYNGEKYIKQCINSAIDQTYSNIEIIVSDDNSSDSTIQIIQKILDESVISSKILYNNSTDSAVDNWNNAIKTASGKYIKMLFQDDYLYLDCIEKMVILAERHKELGFIFSLRDPIYEASIINDYEIKKNIDFILNQKKYLGNIPTIQKGINLFNNKYILNGSNIIGEPSNVLIDKNIFNQIGYFNPELIQLIDLEMWFRIFLKYKIGFINESLSAFRLHFDQLTYKNRNYLQATGNEQFVLLNTLYENLISLPNSNKFSLSIIYEKLRKIELSKNSYWIVIKPFWKLFYSIKSRFFKYLYLK